MNIEKFQFALLLFPVVVADTKWNQTKDSK